MVFGVVGRLVWWRAPALWHEVGVALLRRGGERLPYGVRGGGALRCVLALP